MAEFMYPYNRKRKEFGKTPRFEDGELKILASITQEEKKKDVFVLQNPTAIALDNQQEMSEHAVNTERVIAMSKGMRHIEGGWPKEIDYSESQETAKWRKKQDKEQNFAPAVKELCKLTETCVMQNNQIDMFEEYFQGEVPDYSTENLSTKTLMLFKDPAEHKRSVCKISWHPESSSNKIAVAYAILRFQQMPEKMALQSYIWDKTQPNTPDQVIKGQSPLCTLVFNNKSSDLIIGGCYNGLIALWDLRKNCNTPLQQTQIEKSHHDPVYDIYWLSGKTGTECASCSTDGRILWWDTRKLQDPTDTLQLKEGKQTEGQEEKIWGATCLEYNSEAGPTRYLIGTEQGYIVLANKKPKKSVEIQSRFGQEGGKHHGPIYAIQRNPTELKFFLTVGDWTARIWQEDIRTPIMLTKYHDSYLTDGCWSPTRPGVFFLTRMDGWLDVWDYHYRQNEVAYNHKVGDAALTSIQVQNIPTAPAFGSLVAVGDAEGTVTLMELCDSLYQPQTNEKVSIHQMFEREQNREKNLQVAKRQAQQKSARKEEGQQNAQTKQKALEEKLRKLEHDFFEAIGQNIEDGVRPDMKGQDKEDEADESESEAEIQLGPLTIYYNPLSPPSRAVASFAGLAQIDHTIQEIDLLKGEHKQPEYLEINPAGQVPAIKDADFLLSESIAILIYLSTTRKVADHWYPSDIYKRGLLDRYFSWQATGFVQWVSKLVVNEFFNPMQSKQVDPKVSEEAKAKLKSAMTYLEKVLGENGGFLTGGELSIGDIHGACYLAQLNLVKFDYSEFNNVQEWYNQVMMLPEVSGHHKAVFEMGQNE